MSKVLVGSPQLTELSWLTARHFGAPVDRTWYTTERCGFLKDGTVTFRGEVVAGVQWYDRGGFGYTVERIEP